MCGINGILSFKSNPNISKDLSTMNDLIIHRGPDDDGCYNFDNILCMGMRRLSIIDLSSGKQPISNDDKKLIIVFNGEIYNYIDLRKALINKGVKFNTASDTEVVLKMYEIYGNDFLADLDGMFGFSIFNQNEMTLIIARDRFGEKPIYYTKTDKEFIWSSELKSIVGIRPELKNISEVSLQLFLSLGYIPAPYTIYQNIFKLEPASYLKINVRNLEYSINKYWTVKDFDSKISYKNACNKIQDLLFSSVEKRMISDVPIGVFLSGGVDSTIIASIMSKISSSKINTFTVGFDNVKYDESSRANKIASHIKSNHHNFFLNYDELIEEIDKVILNYDEPIADSYSLSTFFLL